MTRYEVTVRQFKGDTSSATMLEVLAQSPVHANITAVQALDIKNPRFTVSVKPMMEAKKCLTH